MRKSLIAIPLSAALLLSACATNDLGDSRDLNKTEEGAIIGTASGAVLGAIINHKNRGKGALIGAVGGGLTGAGVGTQEYNQSLSERRAQSVLNYFAGQNVNPLRLEAYGRGETQPRADNNTETGRQLNRRVELWILPVMAN